MDSCSKRKLCFVRFACRAAERPRAKLTRTNV
jgi:hypothetical protein